jgi:DNA-binding NarL/FixJ family response regulator
MLDYGRVAALGAVEMGPLCGVGKPEAAVRPVRILLADDNPALLESVSWFLSGFGEVTVVGSAGSGGRLLAQIDRLHPDLVLIDVAMGDMSGLEAVRRVKARRDPPLAVLMTLYGGSAYDAEARACGADGLVRKTELGEQLVPLIHDLVRSRLDERAVPGDVALDLPTGSF